MLAHPYLIRKELPNASSLVLDGFLIVPMWLGKRLVKLMVDDGPGSGFRWTLFTSDAHGLYRLFGFGAPDHTALVRPAR